VGWAKFKIADMRPEAVDYLQKTGALQALPIARLQHMNPPAIEIYSENGIDLTKEPLEIAVCAQHQNGGFAINKWWESTVPHTFVIGEMAGTHGVKRPGGSALNAGQVGASRTAEYITHVYGAAEPDAATAKAIAKAALAEDGWEKLLLSRRKTATVTAGEVLAEIGERMTRYGAHLRSRDGVSKALAAAKAQYAQLSSDGVKFSKLADLPAAVIAVQQCLVQVALLKAICAMFDRGAGSRGSHCILDPNGIAMHPKLIDPETGKPYCLKPENEALRNEIVQLAYNPASPDLFDYTVVPPRPVPERNIAFEPAWTEFRDKAIYRI
jgi:succinate dehydrogenase/fumarate reductase flavoprotein subunit